MIILYTNNTSKLNENVNVTIYEKVVA